MFSDKRVEVRAFNTILSSLRVSGEETYGSHSRTKSKGMVYVMLELIRGCVFGADYARSGG